MNFAQKLDAAILKNNSLLCVGLDPEVDDLIAFNKKIIDSTQTLVCCYKPNSAFYEAQGAAGIEALKQTVDYIHEVDAAIPVILDAKRGDIGNTNKGYIQFAFEYIGADALTLHPYMGGESLEPFFDVADKGYFVVCRTSNPGAGELQNLVIASPDGTAGRGNLKLFEFVAHQAASAWNKNNNVMLVVGATYPEDLQKVREIVGNMTLLVPGIGVQGGDVAKTLQAGLTTDKKGLIIAVGRSIINASDPRGEAERIKMEINTFR